MKCRTIAFNLYVFILNKYMYMYIYYEGVLNGNFVNLFIQSSAYLINAFPVNISDTD